MTQRSLLLVLNAAEARVQWILAQVEQGNAEVLCSQDWQAPSRGTEILPAALEQGFHLLQRSPNELNTIACVFGPGSFTGIRLVLSLASAMRRATGANLAPINYLQALAASSPILPNAGERNVRVLTHARRGLVHCQDFHIFNGILPEPLNEPSMSSLEQALEGLDILASRMPVQIVGSGLTRNLSALMPKIPSGCAPVPVCVDKPSMEALLALALSAPISEHDLEPMYLRPCDAEENLPHIAEMQGRSAESAFTRLSELLTQPPTSQEN